LEFWSASPLVSCCALIYAPTVLNLRPRLRSLGQVRYLSIDTLEWSYFPARCERYLQLFQRKQSDYAAIIRMIAETVLSILTTVGRFKNLTHRP
jgi:hypothetical protein